MTFAILLIVIVVILIVWWALMRNSRKYTADFPAHEEHAGHTDIHAAETAATATPVVQRGAADFVAPAMRGAEIATPADVAAITTEGLDEHVATSDNTEMPNTLTAAETGLLPPADQPFATDFGEPAGGEGAAERFASAAMSMTDDLAMLEGIGPRVKEILGEAGIHTFADLAAADVATLRQVLDGANLRFLDPGTWPEQAKLASEGRLEELQALMSTLRGGRRTNS